MAESYRGGGTDRAFWDRNTISVHRRMRGRPRRASSGPRVWIVQIGTAVRVMRIATGEIEEDIDAEAAAKAVAAELGNRSDKACKQALSPERREEIARNAAIKRWQEQRSK
jgi:hypothetical protein